MNLPDSDAPICASGKRPFRTEEEARKNLGTARYLRGLAPGYKPGAVEERVYECRVCGWWHLTGSTGKRRRGDFVDRDLSRKRQRRRR